MPYSGSASSQGASRRRLRSPDLAAAVASKEPGRIDYVFWFVVFICIVIFSLVAAALLYSVFKFRAAPDDDSDGPPIHGNTTSRSSGR